MTNLKTTGNVWIFQGDTKKYDITTMLGNIDIANEFHWKVSRSLVDEYLLQYRFNLFDLGFG